MKTKVLIIEDNFAKYFTTKQVLEAQLKVTVKAAEAETSQELMDATAKIKPDMILFRPNGGVAELLLKMKKRRTNRRNTEIVLLLADEFDDEAVRKFQSYMESVHQSEDAAAA